MSRIIKMFSLGLFVMFLFNTPGFAQLQDAMRLTLSSSSYSDETVVRFLEVATDSFDTDWDAYKFENTGNTPNFYTVVNQESYAINALHDSFTVKTVPLHADVAFSGTYTITSEEIGPFDSLCCITLIDKVLNIRQDLRLYPTYSFDMVLGDASDRFLIEFKMPETPESSETVTSVRSPSLDANIHIYTREDKVVVEFQDLTDQVSIGVYDLSGREISKAETMEISSSNSLWEFYPEVNGICIVQVMSDNRFYSEKIYINR